MSINPIKKDGRSLRAEKTYDEAHEKLIKSAVELFNNPLVSHEKITVSQIAKHAGVSVATAYNHFPENKLDIYGSLFQLGFKDVRDDLNKFLETSLLPLELLFKKPRRYMSSLMKVLFKVFINNKVI